MKGGYRVPLTLMNPLHYLAAGIRALTPKFVAGQAPKKVEEGEKERHHRTTPSKLKGKRYTQNKSKKRRSRLRKAKAKARTKRLRKG